VQPYHGGELGQQVRAQRIRRGLTQLGLANLSTVGVRTIRDLEAGRTRRPHPITIRLLTSALGINPEGGDVAAHSLDDWEDVGGLDGFDPHVAAVPALEGDIIGREDDVNRLRELMAGGRRFITITGFPGSGKTRLAIEVASVVQATAETRVCWVTVDDPQGGGSVAHVRRAQQAQHDAIVKALSGGGPGLLIIDGARPGNWPGRVPWPPPPDLQVLMTSRRPMGFTGEQIYSILPLGGPFPPAAEAASHPSVRLFAQCISQFDLVSGGNAMTDVAVAELCHRLDGNPALLMAIARTFRMFEPREVLEYVREDIFSVVSETAPYIIAGAREAIEHLDSDAMDLLGQLCELPTDWSVSEIAEHWGDPPLRVGRRISVLLDSGLIRSGSFMGPPRFHVPDLVRAMVSSSTKSAPVTVGH
jgi:transcriptional regulator with XRE-family HTH domain